MKARHTPLLLAVIAGGFDDGEKATVKKCAERLGYRFSYADKNIGGAKVKSILSGKADSGSEAVLNERFVIINGGANAAKLLDIIKSEGVQVPLRAMVTLHSQEWTLNKLIAELKEERKELNDE